LLQDEHKDSSNKAVGCIFSAACFKYSKPDDLQSMVNAGCVPNLVGVLKKPNSIHTNLQESVHYNALKVLQKILCSDSENKCNMLAVQECGGIAVIAKLQVICSFMILAASRLGM
jgi:hypothetical protein